MAIGDSADLGEDQHAHYEALRAILTGQLPGAELRGALDGEPGYPAGLHARLARELGLPGWTIPEEFGGLGKSQVEACAIHIELGRALYPGPFLPSSVAAGALLATGHRETCERWLPRLAAGSVAGTVAVADEAGHWRAGGIRADYGTGGWRLSGRRWYVVAAHVAGIVVVPATTETGVAMFLAEAGSPGLEVSRQLDLDLTRRISIITFEAAPAVLLTKDAAGALARAEREFLIATAAEAAGGIGWCLDASLAHVRAQGGSFEAVASSCVDMLADLENVAAAARYAAAATDVGAADAQKAARVAALRAGESYRRAAEAAIGLLGEVRDAQLYYRRAWSAERLSGGPQAHRDALAAALLLNRGRIGLSGSRPAGRLLRTDRPRRRLRHLPAARQDQCPIRTNLVVTGLVVTGPRSARHVARRVRSRCRDRYAGCDPGA
jgi:alkylation response protein AidB-like acyl-CoA dehydrogenase